MAWHGFGLSVNVCCEQVEVPSSVGDHSAAQFLVRTMTASWHACMHVSICMPSRSSSIQLHCLCNVASGSDLPSSAL